MNTTKQIASKEIKEDKFIIRAADITAVLCPVGGWDIYEGKDKVAFIPRRKEVMGYLKQKLQITQ